MPVVGLTLGGVLVMNLHGDADERAHQFAQNSQRLRQTRDRAARPRRRNLIAAGLRTDFAVRNGRGVSTGSALEERSA